MKTKTLLAALALPAIFAACSQDEFMATQESEFNGTPIGYLEFTATRGGADTRLNLSGWEKDDKIALGWISSGTDLEAGANLYSNHPLYFKGNNGFKSETMVFEGLYIASFPYQETQKVSPLAFDLEKQTSTDLEAAYGKRVYVSDKFVELTEETAGLGNASTLNMVPLTNLMKLNIKLAAGATVPDDFKVLGVKLKDSDSKLVNKLTLASSNTNNVAKDKSTLVTDCWTPAQGDIAVQVGAENEGLAIDATKGLDVYVQLGAFASDDATTLTIETNYGDASIAAGTESVTWSSTGLEQTTVAKVATFADAVKAMNSKAASKPYGQNVSVNVTLDGASIQVPTVVTCQNDLNKIVNLMDKLGMFAADNTSTATIEFSKSTLKKADKVVAEDGDVVITDISGLNKLGGQVTFQKATGSESINVYIAGELGLAVAPVITSVDFTVLNGETLTVTKDLNLGATANLTINAGGKLVNKATITVGSGKKIAISGVDAVTKAPAAIYESNAKAAIAGDGTFDNKGVAHWIAGSLDKVDGVIYADVTTGVELNNANIAFEDAESTATREVRIATDMTVAGQLQSTTFGNITKMTISGKVTFGVNQAEAFKFTNLAEINVETGSFNLTGGDTAEGEDAFYALAAKDACTLTLSIGTELNIPAGAKLDLGENGVVNYNSAKGNNAGLIKAGSATGTGTWEGNAINENPKAE